LWQDWLVLDPRYWPIGLTVLAAAGVVLAGSRRAVLILWAVAVLWAIPMFLDFNETSELRLHMPSALFILLAAAVSAPPLLRRYRPVVIAVFCVVLVTHVLWTAPAVFAPQLSVACEDAIRAAAALAHDGQKTALVVRTPDDGCGHCPHLTWPAYALEPGDRWLSVSDWQAGALQPGERALGVLDTRCYAKVVIAAHVDPALPDALSPHPACAALWRHPHGKPLWQEVIDNVGERGFDWYPDRTQLPRIHQAVLQL
jgi:hypothetical protein